MFTKVFGEDFGGVRGHCDLLILIGPYVRYGKSRKIQQNIGRYAKHLIVVNNIFVIENFRDKKTRVYCLIFGL